MALVKRARLAAMIAVALGLAACTEPTSVFDVDVPELPASTFRRSRPVRPEILGVWLSGGRSQSLGVIVRFSEPMDRDSVAARLAVVATTTTVTAAGQGTLLEPEGALEWNPTATEFLAFFPALDDERIVVVTFAAGVVSQSQIALDGTSGPRPGTDANSYHRFEDDGFSGPSTYISLPYYTGDGRGLESHPTFLQHDMRPGIRCEHLSGIGGEVTGGALGAYQGEPINCRLWDRRRVLQRNGVPLRTAPRAWDPVALPQALFVRTLPGADSETIGAELRLGRRGDLDPRAFWTVAETVGNNGLQLQDLVLAADADFSDWYLAPADAVEPLWPVTGITPPDIVWIHPILATGTGSGDVTITDIDGRAWVANEFAGQRFFNGFDTTVRIRSNRANQLELEAVASCPPCPYQILADIKRRYGVGARVRVVSSSFTLAPVEPLAAGDWELHLSDGRDLWGLAQVDGVRDGDEVLGVPDQVVTFTLTVP